MKFTVDNLHDEINEAIKQFGEYSFYDKGPDEIMNIGPYITEAESMTPNDVADVLVQLAKLGRYEEFFAERMISYLAEQPDVWWNEFVNHPELDKLGDY